MEQSNVGPLDKVLETYVESLNISDSKFDDVQNRYEAIGKWLLREGSTLRDKNPDVYTQGSFLLGTVIKPTTENATLDVDLVCRLDYDKTNISQKDLKERLGKELTEYTIAKGMKNKPKNKKRCWMIAYEDGVRFHADVLPAIPDQDAGYRKYLLENGVSDILSKSVICITDDTLPNYGRIDGNWLRSNPKGYAQWFKERMKVSFAKGAKALLEAHVYNSVEEIPAFRIKTPLQKAIQFLKWHRDVMFEKDHDKRPISIIISTLAAHAYQNEPRLVDALTRIVTDMDKYIEKNGKDWVIKNPVRPDENFADKWKADPTLKENFDSWLAKVRRDLKDASSQKTEKEMIESLGLALGKMVMGQVLENSGYRVKVQSAPTILSYPEVKISPTKQWGNNGRSKI